MYRKKITTLYIIFILWAISVCPCLIVEAKYKEIPYTYITYDGNESHIINNVPYVDQETGFYCRFASLTMLINYYVENVTLSEILFNSGIGYSLAYFHPLKLQPFSGIYVCQADDSTGKYLASLYGLSHDIWKARITKDKWEQYWPVLKEKISQDIPVLTDLDPLSLPWYKENFNFSNETHSGHSIVIVGFNESAGLVYYNDPEMSIHGEEERNCSYIPLSIIDFKKALENLTMPDGSIPITQYMIETFEKVSAPLTKEEAFNISHERNINRMKGKYSEILFNIIPFTDYGIKAVKAMKRDLGIGLRHCFATLMLMKFYNIINYTIPIGSLKGQVKTVIQLKAISTEKQNMSQYLLKNQNLPSICLEEGLLLAEEVEHWNNLSILVNELYQTAQNSFLKTILESRPIIKNMRTELSKIVCIQKGIIELNTY